MSKKQIIITIIAGIVVFTFTFLGVYLLATNDDNKPKEKKTKTKDVLVLKDYTLKYGTYIGDEKEFNSNTNKVETKEVKLVLTKDKIGEDSYIVKDNSIYIDNNGNHVLMYEVTKNNEINLLAGAGIKYIYSK